MDFFNDCKTKEDAKKRYHELAKCFHPDKGGKLELMIILKDQYDKWNPAQIFSAEFSTNIFASNAASRVSRYAPFDHALNIENSNLRNYISQLEKNLEV